MEQGPVLVISFNAQQTMVVRNAKGDVVEGDPVSQLCVYKTYSCLTFCVSAKVYH